MKILNFGSLNIDHVYQVPHFVTPGETLGTTGYQKNAGGKGVNQSIALARAGMDVFHAGQIGEDGLFLKECLEQEGVNTKWIEVGTEMTGHAVIQVDHEGQNCILIHSGANGTVTEDYMQQVFADFEPGDFVLFQNEVAGLPMLLKYAADAGLKIILNPSPIGAEIKESDLSLVDYFILNEVEGLALTCKKDPIEILDELHRIYPKAGVVLTLGGEGAYYSKETEHFFEAARKVDVVDTTAAGDTFTGYFFASLLAGEPADKALHRATKAASITVSRAGAACSIPKHHEV